MGCELVSFSPLRDKELPGDISGLILGGGLSGALRRKAFCEQRAVR